MLGPKTENSVTDSQNVNQVGHNSGTMYIGLTFEQHEKNIRERIAELRADLERAHGAEKALLQAQLDAALAMLQNLQAEHKKALAVIADLRATLARNGNVLDRTRHAAADAALDRGDLSLAQALLEELSAMAHSRREEASKEEAEFEFKLGKIAETQIRWPDAAAHYATAARLKPDFDTLTKAHESAWLVDDDNQTALRFGEELVNWAKTQGTKVELEKALHNQAWTLAFQGWYERAYVRLLSGDGIEKATRAAFLSEYSQHFLKMLEVMQAQSPYSITDVGPKVLSNIVAKSVNMDQYGHLARLYNVARVGRANGRFSEVAKLYGEALQVRQLKLRAAFFAFYGTASDLGPIVFPATINDEVNSTLLSLLQTFFPDDPGILELQRMQDILEPVAKPIPPREVILRLKL